ncbi:uncharacterized protein V6R79_018839 [Siganus canaliculatus]
MREAKWITRRTTCCSGTTQWLRYLRLRREQSFRLQGAFKVRTPNDRVGPESIAAATRTSLTDERRDARKRDEPEKNNFTWRGLCRDNRGGQSPPCSFFPRPVDTTVSDICNCGHDKKQRWEASLADKAAFESNTHSNVK